MNVIVSCCLILSCCFFFNHPSTSSIYTYLHTLSLNDPLPLWLLHVALALGDAGNLERNLVAVTDPLHEPAAPARGGGRGGFQVGAIAQQPAVVEAARRRCLDRRHQGIGLTGLLRQAALEAAAQVVPGRLAGAGTGVGVAVPPLPLRRPEGPRGG